MNYKEIKARIEHIDNELWAIEMCDARNRWAENAEKERALLAEKRALIKMMGV